MITDDRFNRLEDKVSDTAEIVIELRSEVRHMNGKFEEHIEVVKEHILGDNKIIDQLEGIIPHLSEMVRDHSTKKIIAQARKDKWKSIVEKCVDIGKIIGLVSIFGGAVKVIADLLAK